MRNRDQFVPALSQIPPAQSIKLSGKDQVFINRQLVVERKFLRHVTDDVFDRFGIARHVMTIDARGTVAWLQNSAKHSNHRRFSGTVRPQKPKDRSFADLERNVIDGGESAETF